MKLNVIIRCFAMSLAALALPLLVHAQEQCSTLTVKGTYRFDSESGQGFKESKSSGIIIFDGLGNLHGSYALSLSHFPHTGNDQGGLMTGTYAVYPDCTGYVQFETSSDGSRWVDFVTNPDGRQLLFRNHDPGNILVDVAEQQASGKCEDITGKAEYFETDPKIYPFADCDVNLNTKTMGGEGPTLKEILGKQWTKMFNSDCVGGTCDKKGACCDNTAPPTGVATTTLKCPECRAFEAKCQYLVAGVTSCQCSK